MNSKNVEILMQYEAQLQGILDRFWHDREGIHIDQKDDPKLKQCLMELMDLFAEGLKMKRYADRLGAAFEEGIQNFYGSPSYRSVENILAIVKSGRTKIERGLEAENSNYYALHPEIITRCSNLIETEAFPQAVELSFKIVRDRLRKIAGFETASDAFGKGKLYISGAAAEHVDSDFNEGAKFLMMAIDRFRNEKSHTSEGNIHDREHAFQYLALSSLALRFLDRAKVAK